jgi:hypothetical protein
VKSCGGSRKETEGRLRRWNQVFRGAQHDKEKSFLFWGLTIIEDGEAKRGILWRAAQGNRRSFTEVGIRCFAELNMTRKNHYCFGDCRLLKMGTLILEGIGV